MTNTTDIFEQKRIDNMHWPDGLEVSTSIEDGAQNKQKLPLLPHSQLEISNSN